MCFLGTWHITIVISLVKETLSSIDSETIPSLVISLSEQSKLYDANFAREREKDKKEYVASIFYPL